MAAGSPIVKILEAEVVTSRVSRPAPTVLATATGEGVEDRLVARPVVWVKPSLARQTEGGPDLTQTMPCPQVVPVGAGVLGLATTTFRRDEAVATTTHRIVLSPAKVT